MKRSAALALSAAALAGMALGAFTGCDDDMGRLIPNNPPGARLTAHPPDSGTAGYEVEFRWDGWDSDGEVDYFLYAIDPPDMYGSADSVWTRTDAYFGHFVFKASDFDTLYHWENPQIAKGWHVFVLKAVDDMGAVSEPVYLAFNAANIGPRTQFLTPPPSGGVQQYRGAPQQVGCRVAFRWEGEDVDGSFNDGPVGYYFKAVDVTGESNWARLSSRVWDDTTEWTEKGAEDRKTVLYLDDRRAYAIAVRAVDEAGAIEPLLLLNGNMLWAAAREGNSFPELTVRSGAFGERTWQGWTNDCETYEVPLGSAYELIIFGNAGRYGGLITGFSYGWDLEDLDSNETDSAGRGAWTPWSVSRTGIRAEFDEARDYFLYIRCKDDGGGMTLATMRFNVIGLNPVKNLCYIDDWRKYHKDPGYGEALDDEVWQTMLAGYDYGEDWDEVSWDEWEAPYKVEMPTLEFLSRFRVLVWSLMDNRSIHLNSKSAWFEMNYPHTTNVLAVYMASLSAGGERGKVWAFGRGLVESSVLPYAGGLCEYPYAVDDDMSMDPPCGIRPGSFAMDYMHMTGDFNEFDEASGGTRIALFGWWDDTPKHVFVDTAGPAVPEHKYTRPPAAELYPDLPSVLPLNRSSGSRGRPFYYFEVLDYPGPDQEEQHIFYDPVSERMTDLIPLYRLHSRNPESPYQNKYCGFRYIPSDPTGPGEIVYFFFPMFIFDDPGIRATAKVVLSDWFGLPDPDVSGGGLSGRSALVGGAGDN
jgi:hypothetical protein